MICKGALSISSVRGPKGYGEELGRHINRGGLSVIIVGLLSNRWRILISSVHHDSQAQFFFFGYMKQVVSEMSVYSKLYGTAK